ncbi:MAG: hypothetical protein MMC33_005559 [Icmadophila ericetorum]|nr:hypothetical protein [Icmadophila ericetorum]
MHFRDVVEAYMTSKKSGLDGSKHKALNTKDPGVELDPNRHKWVETEIEEVNLESLYRDVEGEETDFLKAAAEYDANAEPKYRVNINIKELDSMKDVMKATDCGRQKYKQNG